MAKYPSNRPTQKQTIAFLRLLVATEVDSPIPLPQTEINIRISRIALAVADSFVPAISAAFDVVRQERKAQGLPWIVS